MKHSPLIALLLLALLSLCALAQKLHDQKHLSRPHPDNTYFQPYSRIQQNAIDDPFKRSPTTPNPKKKPTPGQQPTAFPTKEESQQMWNYRPFEQDDQKQPNEQQDDAYYAQFNHLLKWGMIIGSIFLVFVLVKTCARKNGRREMRRLQKEALQRARVNPSQQQMAYFYAQSQPNPVIINQTQNQTQETLGQKIALAERELNKLKAMQQESLQQEFNRKKMEEEQKRVEAVNAQRRQGFEQARRPQNNWNRGYGPVFYGEQQGQQFQQPFQVKGIEPIRPRSNSYKTETSEREMISAEVNYRNGIPIGKPIRQQDNDSSFASEYPEV